MVSQGNYRRILQWKGQTLRQIMPMLCPLHGSKAVILGLQNTRYIGLPLPWVTENETPLTTAGGQDAQSSPEASNPRNPSPLLRKSPLI